MYLIVETILHAERYGDMFADLAAITADAQVSTAGRLVRGVRASLGQRGSCVDRVPVTLCSSPVIVAKSLNTTGVTLGVRFERVPVGNLCPGGTLVVVLGYEQVGSSSSLLVIVRGPSGSGKSSVAKAVRQQHGRGMAVLGQDVMRRALLWERKDLPGGLAPDFITHSAGFLLNAGWPVIVEGILSAASYGPALRELLAAHRGRNLIYFLQVELAETFARHATRPEADQFSITDMKSWFEPDDRLNVPGEIVIPQTSSLQDTVDRICRDAQLKVDVDGNRQARRV